MSTELPEFKYASIKHAWQMMNQKANGEPGDYDRFRASYGWVRGIKRPYEPFMQDRSYVWAKKAYIRSMLEGWEKYKIWATRKENMSEFFFDSSLDVLGSIVAGFAMGVVAMALMGVATMALAKKH